MNFTWKKDKMRGNVLELKENVIDEEQLIHCLTTIFITFRLHKIIKSIITDVYFYSNDAEVEQLIDTTNGIIKENSYTPSLFHPHNNIETYMNALILSEIRNETDIYFDNVLSSCMKPLQKQLIEAVAYAIDESKREEEHQRFIDSIRTYIKKNESRIDELFIVQQNDTFLFFNALGKQYTVAELRTLMDKEPLYLFGLDKNELHLSPVITLLPRHIYIYGNDPSDAKTLTIVNLFQERVTLFSHHEFPFYLQNKNS